MTFEAQKSVEKSQMKSLFSLRKQQKAQNGGFGDFAFIITPNKGLQQFIRIINDEKITYVRRIAELIVNLTH